MAQRRSSGRPLGDVIADLQKAGYRISLDSLQRLRTERLVQFKEYLTPDDIEHLTQILDVRNALGPKWSMSQLAFFMAFLDIKGAPPDLVAEHIENEIGRWIQHQDWLLNRQAPGKAIKGASTSHERMAAVSVRKHARDLGMDRKDTRMARALDGMTQWYAVFFGIIEFDIDLRDLDKYLRSAVSLTIENSDEEMAFYHLMREILEEAAPWMRRHARSNALIQAARNARMYEASRILQAARDAFHLMSYINFILLDVPGPDFGSSNKTHQYRLKRMVTPVPALLAAICLCLAKKEQWSAFIKRLRRRDLPDLRKEAAVLYSDAMAEIQKQKTCRA